MIAVIVFLAFISLYFKAAHSKSDKILPIIIAMIILCILGTYITPGTQSLFGFIAFFCGYHFAFKKSLFALVAIMAAILFAAFTFNFYELYFIAPALIISAALLFMGQAERKDRIHSQREKVSQASIKQLATIAERERIARDLHDLIGHSLTSIALKAELAEKYLTLNKISLAQGEINEVAALSRSILSEVRQAVSGLKNKNLTAQINQLKAKLEHHNFHVTINNQVTKIAPVIESNLVLIITEAVTNILKHSNGDQVAMTLTQSDHGILLHIVDNGQANALTHGNGLMGITERCQQLKGTVDITYHQGVSLIVNIPEVNFD